MILPPSFHKAVTEASNQCHRGGRTPHHLYLPPAEYQEWQQLCAFDHQDTRSDVFNERVYMGLMVRQSTGPDVTVSELPLT
jgi:hypothetical protein